MREVIFHMKDGTSYEVTVGGALGPALQDAVDIASQEGMDPDEVTHMEITLAAA